MDDVQGMRFGQFTPPLVTFLKDILDKYPEGGQIIKELIQNADDAGATEVKFLLSARDYGKETLLSPSLAEFQGAAFYCYNNGVFTDEDWSSIQSVQQSKKKKDPLKVGRFGLGFVSVYHLTDMPSIMSSDRIAFFDPFMKHFHGEQSGKAFPLNRQTLQKYPDQFSPYTNILGIGSEQFSEGSFGGTLFRFPLRTKPSPDLSSTIFTSERIRELFESFKEDADVILMFLKHVTSVSLFEATSDGEEKLVFEVKNNIVDGCGKSHFLEALQHQNKPPPHITKHRMTLTNEKDMSVQHWIVLNQVVTNTTERIRCLAEELKLLPWIGLAMQCQDKEVQMIDGRVFCFLPLPPCEESKTGFPVHIHGYFGLSDNRRSLKWPAADQKHDVTAEWNQLLVEELLPKAYALLITHAVEQSLSPNDVYRAFPTLDKIKPHWTDFVQTFIDIISDKEVLHTRARGGRWISLKDAILDVKEATLAKKDGMNDTEIGLLTDNGTVPKAVIDYLVVSCEQQIVSLPDNVLKCVLRSKLNLTGISSALLRRCVREYGVSHCTTDEKTILLQFCLDDDNVSDLQDVPLLRLSDGSYTTFSDPSSTPVFLPTPEIPITILPKSCESFEFIHPNLIGELGNKLENIAKAETCQLRFIRNEDVVNFLRKALPIEWSVSDQAVVNWTPGVNGHPTEEWLEVLWSWLLETFDGDINVFNGLPIIPIDDTSMSKYLLKVSDKIPVLLAAAESTEDLDNTCACLKQLGVIILSNPPQFLRHQKLRRYINEMTPTGVLEVLVKCGPLKCAEMNAALDTERRSLRHVLAQLTSSSMSPYRKKIICELPIYERFPESGDSADGIGTNNASSVMKSALEPFLGKELPAGIRLKQNVVTTDDPDTQTLTSLLGVRLLKLSDVVSNHILPVIERGFYKPAEIDEIMPWILNSLASLKKENPNLPDAIKQLRFVRTSVSPSRRLKANEVFDPQDEVLKNLLQGKDVFPVEPYCHPGIIVVLQELGLKNTSDLIASEIFEAATRCEHENTDGFPKQRASALLQCIDANTTLLSEMINGTTLLQQLKTLNWIPRLQEKPSNYPSILPWYEDEACLSTPPEMYSKEYATCVGAVKPVIKLPVSDDLKKQFEWNRIPPIQVLLEQLHVVVDTWFGLKKSDKSSKAIKEVEDAVCTIYLHLQSLYETEIITSTGHRNSAAIMSELDFQWVWNGNGFTKPQRMALTSSCTFDLKPHLFEIPRFLRKWLAL